MSISLGIFFGIGAMTCFGLLNAVSQVPIKEIGIKRTIFFRNLFISIVLLITLLFFLQESVFDIKYILITLLISLIGYIALISFYNSLNLGKVGVIVPITGSSVVFTILFSVIFFNESLVLPQLAAIGAIVAGIILISLDFEDVKRFSLLELSSGIPYALVSCFLWGLVSFLFKIPVMILGPILTSFLAEFGICILSGINLRVSKMSFELPEKRMLAYLLAIALLAAAASIFFNLGIRIADVSIVAAITFANPFISALYGKFVYKERLKAQQWFAMVLILVGIISLSYF